MDSDAIFEPTKKRHFPTGKREVLGSNPSEPISRQETILSSESSQELEKTGSVKLYEYAFLKGLPKHELEEVRQAVQKALRRFHKPKSQNTGT